MALANPHGDTATTVTIPAGTTATTPAVTIGGWADYTEYGLPNTAADGASGVTAADVDQVDGALGYGWLGAKQRSTSIESAGLTLMGVRLYNARRGLFTSVDPVPGGNTTAYTYPQDPINAFDLDGRWGWLKSAWNGVKAAGRWAWKNRGTIANVTLTVASFIPATAGVAWAYRAWQGYRAVRGMVSVARIGTRMSNSRWLGTSSRLFGNSTLGARRPGLLNPPGKDRRFALGWSVNTVERISRRKAIGRTVLRAKVFGKKMDITYGRFL
ncbi:hypothetical protein [Intrasporangium sp. DVR]|uniref:hypothetical protein n=1 Tax=Intrasporangium sp. DVR TaxID=3127867 RepID=UPI00313A6017